MLMLITHTHREIVTVFPGFHVMAMSMQDLQIAQAGILTVPVDVVDLQGVIMLDVQPTVGTAPALLFQQGRQSSTDRWVSSMSSTPIHPIAIVRTPITSDFCMSPNRDLAMRCEHRLALTSCWGRKNPTRVVMGPVAMEDPSGHFLWV